MISARKTPRLRRRRQRPRASRGPCQRRSRDSWGAPPGAASRPSCTQAALLGPRPGPPARGTGLSFVEGAQQALDPTRPPPHPPRRATRGPPGAPRGRRQAPLIAAVTALQAHRGDNGQQVEPVPPPRPRLVARTIGVLTCVAMRVLPRERRRCTLPARAAHGAARRAMGRRDLQVRNPGLGGELLPPAVALPDLDHRSPHPT